MSPSALVLLFALGAGALALWIEARFAARTPQGTKAIFVHAALALLAVQLVAPTLRLILGEQASHLAAMLSVLAILLPALVYAFLSSIWLLKLVQGGLRHS